MPELQSASQSAQIHDVLPRVSVLMAVFNCADFVEEAMRSVFDQSLVEIELIVIDDGSTDGSHLVIERIASQDLRVVARRQHNQGVAAATNHALSLARATYVAILDSDDLMEPERLALQAAYLDEHGDIAAVGTQWYTIDAQGQITGIDRHSTDWRTSHVLMLNHFSAHHPTLMVRRVAIEALGGYVTTPKFGAQDYELFSRLTLSGQRLANLPYPLTRWRVNPQGITHGRAREQTQHCVEIRESRFDALARRTPGEADEIALALVRAFPTGSWFDLKVAQLLPETGRSSVQQRWQQLVGTGTVPPLEAAIVSWLNDEEQHASQVAKLLEQAECPWLAALVKSRNGDRVEARTVLDSTNENDAEAVKLSVLIPVTEPDSDLGARVRMALASIPAQSAEVLVFGSEPFTSGVRDLLNDPRLKMIPVAGGDPGWQLAINAARGRFMAFLEQGARHHADFLEQAIALLEQDPAHVLSVAPPKYFYQDIVTPDGVHVPDPTPEPRWTRDTLLGRDRCRLSSMVVRRQTLLQLPVKLAETGSETGWCIARALLTRHPAVILEKLRTTIVEPPAGLSDNLMRTLVRRLVGWHMDSGLGCVPAEYAWSRITPSNARERLKALDAQLAADNLCIHPGNCSVLLRFAARFSAVPFASRCIRTIAATAPQLVHTALSEAGRKWSQPALRAWRFQHRLKGRARRLLTSGKTR